MKRSSLTKMTRIDVVVGGDDLALVRDLFTAAGVTGLTVLANVSGLGHNGWHEGRMLFNDVDGLTMLFAVTPDEQADGVIAALSELFVRRPGVMFVSDSWVSRPSYFAPPADA